MAIVRTTKGTTMKLQRNRILSTLAGFGLLATVFFAAPVVAAPGGGGHGGRGDGNHQQRFEKMKTELGLSADQASRIQAIMEANKGDVQQLRDQMKNTFTPEQQAQMKTLRESRKNGGEKASREERKTQWEQLGLSDGQKQQMKNYREQMKTKRESIKAQISQVLTPEQQQKLEAMKSERAGKRGQRGGRGGGEKG